MRPKQRSRADHVPRFDQKLHRGGGADGAFDRAAGKQIQREHWSARASDHSFARDKHLLPIAVQSLQRGLHGFGVLSDCVHRIRSKSRSRYVGAGGGPREMAGAFHGALKGLNHEGKTRPQVLRHHGSDFFGRAVLEGGGVDFSWNGGHFFDGRAAGRVQSQDLSFYRDRVAEMIDIHASVWTRL